MKLPSTIKGWLSTKQIHLTSPEEIMTQYILTGKRRYLSLLVEEFNGALFHYLLSQSDSATAEDVVQSTWLKVMNTQSKIAPTYIKSWLFTIARNTLIDELRKQKKWHVSNEDEQQLLCTNLNAEQQLAHQNNIDKFNSALLQLPILQREAFIFQQEGFSIIDICELTHSSHETVKSRLRYARTYLKKHDRNIVMSADKFDKEIESLYIERKQSIKAPTIAFNAVPKKPKARLMESLSILAMGGIASFSIFAVINHFAHIKPETSESLLLDSTALQVASVLADKNVKQFTLKPIYKVMPVFSRTATHENGQIKLTYKVNAKGAVDNIRIMESSVNRTLEKSAKKALSQWQFTPGMNTEEKLHIVFQFNNE